MDCPGRLPAAGPITAHVHIQETKCKIAWTVSVLPCGCFLFTGFKRQTKLRSLLSLLVRVLCLT